MLILLLIFQLLFTSIYLFSKKQGRPVNNKILGCFFLSICLSLADNLALRTGFWLNYPAGATLTSTFPFLYGPLLFLYTQSLVYKKFDLDKRKLLHFLPFALFFTFFTAQYELQPASLKIEILHTISAHRMSPYFYVGALVMIAHFGAYALTSLLLINKHKTIGLNKFSSIQQTNLNWLSSMIVFFVVLFALSLINNVFEAASLSKFYPVTLLAIILLLFYFINRVLFKALHDPLYFSWMEHDETPVKIAEGALITKPDKSMELNAITAFMQKQKPYLNPELTVETLAIALQMHPKDLSKLINEHLQQNFFDFVNRYRINDAQNMLTNNPDKKITVLEVLYKCGFNSKSSFNTLFKKYTGFTPTDFKNQSL